MNVNFQSGKKVVRFRRLTRKAYSIFASLSICVTIGRLRVQVADRSLAKQSGKKISGWNRSDREITDPEKRQAKADTGNGPGLCGTVPQQTVMSLMLCTSRDYSDSKKIHLTP